MKLPKRRLQRGRGALPQGRPHLRTSRAHCKCCRVIKKGQGGSSIRHLPFANHFIAMLPASGDAPTRGDIPHAIGARVGAARPNSAPSKKRILGDLHHIASAIAELVSSLSIIPPMRSFDVPPKHSAPLTRGLFLRRSTSCVESRCLLSDLDRSGERLVPVRLIVKALLPQESCPFPVLVRHHQEHRPFLHSKADSCDSHHSASATPALIM